MKIKEIHVEFPEGKTVERSNGYAKTTDEHIHMSIIPNITDTNTNLMFWGEAVDINIVVTIEELDSIINILSEVKKSQ